jgi:hypothetical protein
MRLQRSCVRHQKGQLNLHCRELVERSECEVKILLLFVAAACQARWTLNYHLSTSNYLTSAHVDGRRLNGP